MENNQMKNMVVLKNLPSNLVEEAIVIFKSKKSAKKFQYIDKQEGIKKENNKNSKDYIVREAESVISNYINNVENKGKRPIDKNINKKYKKLKIYSIVITIAFVLAIIL